MKIRICLPILETVARETMIVWIDNLCFFLAFRSQENNIKPTMPEDCASMKLGVA